MLAVSVKPMAGVALEFMSPTRHLLLAKSCISAALSRAGSIGESRVNGMAPEKSMALTPGNPNGGWVRSSLAFEPTRTPIDASASVASLVDPAGEAFSIVQACRLPSARSSMLPVLTPPRGGAERIPAGGTLQPASMLLFATGGAPAAGCDGATAEEFCRNR